MKLMHQIRVSIVERLASSYWVIPLLFVAAAVGAGLGVPEIDAAFDGTLTVTYSTSAAIELVSAVAGGMIAFTGFVFAIVVLLVQYGSSQYSPRLLRRFMRDPVPKVAIGMFSATFIYALFVLAGIGGSGQPDFVPDLSVTIAIVLVAISTFTFLWLLNHSYQQVRIGNVVRDVAEQSRRAIDGTYPEPTQTSAANGKADPLEPEAPEAPAEPGGRAVGHAGSPGILQGANAKRLLKAATAADALVVVRVSIGDFVPSAGTLVTVYEPGADQVDAEAVRRAFDFDVERSIEFDPAQGIRWLVDIAIKALSPAVNDPTTAVQAIDHIDELLRRLGGRSLLVPSVHDRGGTVRVTFLSQTWRDYVELALTEIRVYGKGSVQIERRLRALLHDLRELLPSHRIAAIEEQLSLLDAGIRDTYPEREQAIVSVPDRQGIGWARQRAAWPDTRE
jgi:uncharacterized membrane protein